MTVEAYRLGRPLRKGIDSKRDIGFKKQVAGGLVVHDGFVCRGLEHLELEGARA